MDTPETDQQQFDEIASVQIGADGTGSTVLHGIDPATVSNLTILRFQQGSVAMGSWHGLPAITVAGAMPGVGVEVGYDLTSPDAADAAVESEPEHTIADSAEPASAEPDPEPAADSAPDVGTEENPIAVATEPSGEEGPAPQDIEPAQETPNTEPEPEPEAEAAPVGDQGSPDVFVLYTYRTDRDECHAYGAITDQAALEQIGSSMHASDPAVEFMVLPLEAVPV
jgi:hypothetical protein